MIDVAVGAGVGEAVGAEVGGFVVTAGAVGCALGEAVGATVGAVVGRTVGADVRGSGVRAGEAEPPGTEDATGSAGPASGTPEGDAVAAPDGGNGFAPSASRVRLKPASATATARDGPRRTYRVKDARPRRSRAGSLDFPCPPMSGR
jgi:hypothetical protein